MPSTKEVKQRIKSVKNIAQITKAMEAVSATKMRKSQEFALRARPFALSALGMLQNVLTRSAELPPILAGRGDIRTKALLVVTSDKGLAGAFNANVLRRAEEWIGFQRKERMPFRLVAVGKKAKDYFGKRGYPIEESFVGFGDFSEIRETTPIAETIVNGYMYGLWDWTDAVYTNFRSTISQEATVKRILPANKESIEEIVAGILPERGKFAKKNNVQESALTYHYEYAFEPSSQEILSQLIPLLLRMHIHHIILESNASEHSARMVAMKAASDNAKELIGNLQLVFNKTRQAGITRELSEITAGKEALEQ